MKLEAHHRLPSTYWSIGKVSHRYLRGTPIQVSKLYILTDFIVLEMEEYEKILIILERSFLAMVDVLIDVKNGKLMLTIGDIIIEFNVFRNDKKYPFPRTSNNTNNLKTKPDKNKNPSIGTQKVTKNLDHIDLSKKD